MHIAHHTRIHWILSVFSHNEPEKEMQTHQMYFLFQVAMPTTIFNAKHFLKSVLLMHRVKCKNPSECIFVYFFWECMWLNCDEFMIRLSISREHNFLMESESKMLKTEQKGKKQQQIQWNVMQFCGFFFLSVDNRLYRFSKIAIACELFKTFVGSQCELQTQHVYGILFIIYECKWMEKHSNVETLKIIKRTCTCKILLANVFNWCSKQTCLRT